MRQRVRASGLDTPIKYVLSFQFETCVSIHEGSVYSAYQPRFSVMTKIISKGHLLMTG